MLAQAEDNGFGHENYHDSQSSNCTNRENESITGVGSKKPHEYVTKVPLSGIEGAASPKCLNADSSLPNVADDSTGSTPVSDVQRMPEYIYSL